MSRRWDASFSPHIPSAALCCVWCLSTYSTEYYLPTFFVCASFFPRFLAYHIMVVKMHATHGAAWLIKNHHDVMIEKHLMNYFR